MKGRMVGKAMLTAKQKTLPKQLQEKMIKSKMKKKKKKKNTGGMVKNYAYGGRVANYSI